MGNNVFNMAAEVKKFKFVAANSPSSVVVVKLTVILATEICMNQFVPKF